LLVLDVVHVLETRPRPRPRTLRSRCTRKLACCPSQDSEMRFRARPLPPRPPEHASVVLDIQGTDQLPTGVRRSQQPANAIAHRAVCPYGAGLRQLTEPVLRIGNVDNAVGEFIVPKKRHVYAVIGRDCYD